MWFLLLLLCVAYIEPVILEVDEKRLILKGKKPCEGHVQIYNEKKWRYVGNTGWNRSATEVVCRSTQCGNAKTEKEILAPIDREIWLNNIKCNGTEDHLWDCSHPGFGFSSFRADTTMSISCSNEVSISLDGFECAGAVKYTIGARRTGYFCADNWDKHPEAVNLLCKNLGCGDKGEMAKDLMVVEAFSNSEKMNIDCPVTELDHLWQCATSPTRTCSNPAVVKCDAHKTLQLKWEKKEGEESNVCQGQLMTKESTGWTDVSHTDNSTEDDWCKQLHCGNSSISGRNGIQLNCTDNVSIVLKDKSKVSKCYGVVHVKVNTDSYPVCASGWTVENTEMVCKELGCGEMISELVTRVESTKNAKGIMDNVKCTGDESSLWYCNAKRAKKPFTCSSNAYVVCSGSVNVKLMDGPGKCAGRVEINYEGRWRRALQQGWTEENSNVVCKQLNCGRAAQGYGPEKFSKGSADFLAQTVKCNTDSASNISECVKKEQSNPIQREPVMLTCEKRSVVFLDGFTCSGRVGIEQGSQTYWLSGSNDTWNKNTADAVCRQMHCGSASTSSTFSNVSSESADTVWEESYNCLPNTTSLFDCEKGAKAADHNATIATVICTGNITAKLTHHCWGNVNIYVEGQRRHVCNDTWTKENSEKLCEDLGCGKALDGPQNQKKSHEKAVTSLHCTGNRKSLTQCNIVNYEQKDPCEPAHVICSGSIKASLNDSRYKCSGNVEVINKNFQIPVCMNALGKPETQNIICKDLGCGQAVKTVDYFGPKTTQTQFISDISCPAGGEQLQNCDISVDTKSCTLGGLQCSGWRKMELKFSKSSCSGAVFVHSQDGRQAVSGDGWTDTESKALCEHLDCGSFVSNDIRKENADFWSGSFSCANVTNPKNIWACENTSLIPPQQKQLYIECKDKANVTLSGKDGGEVRIDNVRVCSNNNWNMKLSHLVCMEKLKSNAVHFDYEDPTPTVDYFHVSCESYHDKLGQCRRFKGKCHGKLVSVYCFKNVNFSKPERCGGLIEVNYRNKWETACEKKPFPTKFKNELCQQWDCGGYSGKHKTTKKYSEKGSITLDCTTGAEARYCVSPKSCDQDKPAEIYCDDYVEDASPPPPPGKIEVVPIILGVGLFLILVILIVVFVRVCIVRRAKRPFNDSMRMSSRKDVEFESGDYEDVTGKENEMDDFNHGSFRQNTEFIAESDARSVSSLPYDDIEEALEAQPLTSPAPLDQSSDGVTYEVDDPQENYDDIEAGPEITQTTAEVHESPQTAPDSVAAEPLHSVQGDQDYLVPGQDG